jgi:poly-gamma-glutamate synthesis protein (capsule biosynthesis protein)
MIKNFLKTITLFILALVAVILTAFFIYQPTKTSPSPIIQVQNKLTETPKIINKLFTKKIEAPQRTTLIAVGDISFSRGVDSMIKKYDDYDYPLLGVKDYLATGDIVFGNLETSITSGRHILDNEMVFRSDVETARTLADNNFSIVSLANNHTPNFGQQGLLDTFQYLDQAGIKYVGAGRNSAEANEIKYIESNGLKFAFLAYNDDDVVPPGYEAGAERAGTAFMQIDKMKIAVAEAKQNADFVIVSMHSGYEYQPEPNDSQIEFAHATIDTGADLVLGHHPHVIQTAEKYNGKWIFYSLGNFIFDQPWSEETMQTMVTKFYFTEAGIDKIEFLPLKIENFCQPNHADEIEAEKIIKRLGVNFKKDGESYVLKD